MADQNQDNLKAAMESMPEQAASSEQAACAPTSQSTFLDDNFFKQTNAARKRINAIRLKRPTLSQRIARALAGGG